MKILIYIERKHMQPLKIRKHLNEERTCVRLCSIWKLNASEKQRRKRAVFIAFWGNSSQIRENMERWWKKWINEKGKRIFLQRLMELDWRSRRISWSLALKWSSFQFLHVFFFKIPMLTRKGLNIMMRKRLSTIIRFLTYHIVTS